MTPDNSTIATLHHEYRKLTGYELGLDYWRESCWSQWIAKGFTVDDLRTVIGWLKDGIKADTRRSGALKFSNLIGQPDRFEEDLVTARAELRNKVRKLTDKQLILKASGRTDPTKTSTHRTAADILAAEKAFAEFVALKKSL